MEEPAGQDVHVVAVRDAVAGLVGYVKAGLREEKHDAQCQDLGAAFHPQAPMASNFRR
ncbi:hypothetical protein [Streptomyces sp. BE133]|uniref:hypothetical protein n=1 Tax=Streptomyces sp. BE133 TaxID=3002523 RepID=UPI002E775E4F|nr:hypothetical protein [Streptomyces sp. BE133]MEE1808322.1 hypothetical protein [Streptomyces sp. BE133]